MRWYRIEEAVVDAKDSEGVLFGWGRTIRSPSSSNSPNGGTERRRDPRVNVCQH